MVAQARGATVVDTSGRTYIDALSGVAVNTVGHCHPKVVAAVKAQADKVLHVSNFYVTEPQVRLSQRLSELSTLERVFFCNSGAEAVEGAIKMARRYGHSQGRGGRILHLERGFHGRTLAAVAMAKPAMQAGFDPLPTGFTQLPPNDIEALREALADDVCAVIMEPIQGEGGVYPLDSDYLKAARTLCQDADVLLIFDEIQSGIGRTGNWFAWQQTGVRPDIMTLAKGLGGGVPIGAICLTDPVAKVMKPGDHGSTFGGNPLACAAAMATLAVIEEENLLEAAADKGRQIRKHLRAMPELENVRGQGLLIGADTSLDAKAVVERLRHHRVLGNATGPSTLRLLSLIHI